MNDMQVMTTAASEAATAMAKAGSEIAAVVSGTKQQTTIENQKKSTIQVSNTKKPLFFYVNLAKRYLQQYKEIELSALGMAITTVVTISEILKNNGLVNEKSITTSTVSMKDATKGRMIQKARIEIVLEKSEKFDSLMRSSQNANENGKTEKQQQQQQANEQNQKHPCMHTNA